MYILTAVASTSNSQVLCVANEIVSPIAASYAAVTALLALLLSGEQLRHLHLLGIACAFGGVEKYTRYALHAAFIAAYSPVSPTIRGWNSDT